MKKDCLVHLFRSPVLKPGSPAAVVVAPIDAVRAVYGAGGAFDAAGLSAVFGGAVVFRNEENGDLYAGVWGARNVPRFRAQLRSRFALTIIEGPPPARMVYRCAGGNAAGEMRVKQ